MALSDLDLIQLAESAREGRKGDKGEAGVGIDDIRQPEKGSFITVLTDGRTRKIPSTARKTATQEKVGTRS